MNAPAGQPLPFSCLESGILRLTLNRPRARSTLSSALMAALQARTAARPLQGPRRHGEDRQGILYRQQEMPLAEAYDRASQVMAENMPAADAEEGICAFLEKRQPKWP